MPTDLTAHIFDVGSVPTDVDTGALDGPIAAGAVFAHGVRFEEFMKNRRDALAAAITLDERTRGRGRRRVPRAGGGARIHRESPRRSTSPRARDRLGRGRVGTAGVTLFLAVVWRLRRG